MKTYSCPKCGREVTAKDINVGRLLPELHLTHPGSSNTVHICAGMSEDALDYIAALLKREAGRV